MAKLVKLEITPDNIDEHIALCKTNRARVQRHVGTFVRLIKLGVFRNGGFIFADTKGLYHDAQHRLQALKVTKHSAWFWLVTGLNREDLNMMLDGGKKRTNAQRLASTGTKNASLICSAIEESLETVEHWRKGTEMLMADEVLAYLHANPELEALATNWATSGIDDVPKRYLVAFQHLFTKIDKAKADQFFLDISHRELLKAGQPVHAFYAMLSSDAIRTDVNRSRVNRCIRNGILVAWAAFVKGEKLDTITPSEFPITLEGTALDRGDDDEVSNGNQDDDDGEADAEEDV